MDLLVHVSNDHHEDEEEWDAQNESTQKSDREGEKASFIFSDSMLDEFLKLIKKNLKLWNGFEDFNKTLEGQPFEVLLATCVARASNHQWWVITSQSVD